MGIKDIVPWTRNRRDISLRREEPSLFRGMERMFENFLAESGLEPSLLKERWDAFSPRIDISEDKKEVVVTAEVPGMDENDFDISVNNDSLTIHGEKKAEKEEKKENYYRMERSYGAFHRTVALPCEVDVDRVEARYRKGVLKITLPKLPEDKQQRRRIEVH